MLNLAIQLPIFSLFLEAVYRVGLTEVQLWFIRKIAYKSFNIDHIYPKIDAGTCLKILNTCAKLQQDRSTHTRVMAIFAKWRIRYAATKKIRDFYQGTQRNTYDRALNHQFNRSRIVILIFVSVEVGLFSNVGTNCVVATVQITFKYNWPTCWNHSITDTNNIYPWCINIGTTCKINDGIVAWSRNNSKVNPISSVDTNLCWSAS